MASGTIQSRNLPTVNKVYSGHVYSVSLKETIIVYGHYSVVVDFTKSNSAFIVTGIVNGQPNGFLIIAQLSIDANNNLIVAQEYTLRVNSSGAISSFGQTNYLSVDNISLIG